MPIRFPGFEIREPLRRRPFSGALIGALTGGVFALIAGASAFHVSREAQTIGFIAGGASGGAIIGLLAPWFRKRTKAATAVGIAVTIGLFIANYAWREYAEPGGSLGLGVLAAVIYWVALWDYRGGPE